MQTLSLTKETSLSPETIIKSTGLHRKLLTPALSFILLALLFAPVQAQKKDALWQTYMDAGWKAEGSSYYAEAEKLYKLAQARASAFGELDERRVFTSIRLAGLYLKWEGRDADAEPFYTQIVALLDRGAGADSLMNAERVSSLAHAYQNRQRFKEAEPLFKHAVAIYRKGMRPGDVKITNYLFSLGSNLYSQGYTEAAEKVFRECVEIVDRDLIHREEMTAVYALTMLGYILKDQGKFDEAEAFLKRSLKSVEKSSGENAPETAIILRAAFLILSTQAKISTEAELMMKRLISINESVYGPMSATVQYDTDLLGTYYFRRARYAEAEQQFQRVLDILEKTPSAQTSQIDSAGTSLTFTYYRQRKYAEMEAVCKRVRGIVERKFPQTPKNNLLVNECFESFYFLSGNYSAEAEVLNRSVEFAEKMGAEGESTIADKLTSLGSSYARQRKYEMALTVFRRAEKIYAEKSLPATPSLLIGFARIYYFLGKYAESEPLFLKAIDLVEQKKDAVSVSNAAWFRKGYALLLYAQGKTAQGEEMFQKAIEVFKADKDTGQRDMASSWHELATLFAAQGKYAEAEQLFRQAKDIREKVLAPAHDDLATTLEGYAALLKKTGRTDEAAPLERQAQAIRAKHSAH